VSKVQWTDVERAAIYESIMQRRHDAKNVLSAVIKHSPGMVDQARQEKARQLISNLAGKEISSPQLSKQHEGLSR
jgi:hypothetical protein